MKIVQEGGLEPLALLMVSEEIEVLREVTAALCNISLSDENKFEMAKAGILEPLIKYLILRLFEKH